MVFAESFPQYTTIGLWQLKNIVGWHTSSYFAVFSFSDHCGGGGCESEN